MYIPWVRLRVPVSPSSDVTSPKRTRRGSSNGVQADSWAGLICACLCLCAHARPQWIQLQLWERHGLRTLRRTLKQLSEAARVDDQDGTLSLHEGGETVKVLVVYYRCGASAGAGYAAGLVCTRTCTHTLMHTYAHKHMCVHMHKHTFTHKHCLTNAHMQTHVLLSPGALSIMLC